MVYLDGTLEHRRSPLLVYIDGASRIFGSPFPIGEKEMEPPSKISYADLDSGMRRSELHRV